jgi:hypothetical protein
MSKKENMQQEDPQNLLTKKAVLVIELGYESIQTSNDKIMEDIKKEAQIPWCSKIRKIEVYNSSQ